MKTFNLANHFVVTVAKLHRTVEITVVAADGTERRFKVSSQAGYNNMIKCMGVQSLAVDGSFVEDYASLEDGRRYTLGPKACKVIHIVDGRGGEWDYMLANEAGYDRLLDRHGTECLVNEDGIYVVGYGSLDDGCSYRLGEQRVNREDHHRPAHEQQAQ